MSNFKFPKLWSVMKVIIRLLCYTALFLKVSCIILVLLGYYNCE